MLQRQLSLVKQAFLPLEIDLGAATHAAFDQSCIISTRQNLPTPVQNYDHSQNSGFNYFDFRHTFNMPARPSRPKGRELDPAKKKMFRSHVRKREHMGNQIIGQVPGPVVAYPATEGINLPFPFLLLRSGGFALFALLSPSQ